MLICIACRKEDSSIPLLKLEEKVTEVGFGEGEAVTIELGFAQKVLISALCTYRSPCISVNYSHMLCIPYPLFI